MKKYFKFCILIFTIAIIACQFHDEKSLLGKYGAQGYINNYDTLWLRENGVYKRKFIQKLTSQELIQEGEWKISKSKNRQDIYLKPFYRNTDADTITANLFQSLSSFGTALMVENTLTGYRLLQNGDMGWYYIKVE